MFLNTRKSNIKIIIMVDLLKKNPFLKEETQLVDVFKILKRKTPS